MEMTNRAKALEALDSLEVCFDADEWHEHDYAEIVANIKTLRAALHDAPRVEVIHGLEDALWKCRDVKQSDWLLIYKAAIAYAKLQGKGE